MSEDKGAESERRAPKPCARRLANKGWCVLPTDHDGPCVGTANDRAQADPATLYRPSRAR